MQQRNQKNTRPGQQRKPGSPKGEKRSASGEFVEQAKYWLRKLWNNYVVRNLILAAGAVLILVFLASLALKVITRHNRYKEVPEFVGVNIYDAQKMARKANLNIEINDSLFVPIYEPGMVLEQNPEAGTNVKSGRNIFVTINSFTQKKVEIPYVKGFSLRQAKNILETAGLEIEKIVYVNDMATNYVLEQSYNGKVIRKDTKMSIEMGSGITLTVGRSHSTRPIGMPRVVGLSLRDAKSRLWENGFNVGKITYDEGIELIDQRSAKVYEQSVPQGRNTTLGTSVALKLTLDDKKIGQSVSSSEKASRRIVEEQAIADSLEAAQKALQALVDSVGMDAVTHTGDSDDFFE